jgi:hypothetical protein
MKKILFLSILAVFTTSLYQCGKGVKGHSTRTSSIIFDTIMHNFGEIPFGGKAEFEFVFTNAGMSPLVLTHVKSTCGCTIPEWSKEPVNAGGKGRIHVKYDTKRVGTFNKSVYVYSNAENGVQRLMISGKVRSADT